MAEVGIVLLVMIFIVFITYIAFTSTRFYLI